MKYRTLQISPDGEAYIFDYESNSKDELWDKVNDQGSKWVFFPLPFIVKNEPWMDFKHKRIIDAPYGYDFLKGSTIRNAMKWIKNNQDYTESIMS